MVAVGLSITVPIRQFHHGSQLCLGLAPHLARRAPNASISGRRSPSSAAAEGAPVILSRPTISRGNGDRSPGSDPSNAARQSVSTRSGTFLKQAKSGQQLFCCHLRPECDCQTAPNNRSCCSATANNVDQHRGAICRKKHPKVTSILKEQPLAPKCRRIRHERPKHPRLGAQTTISTAEGLEIANLRLDKLILQKSALFSKLRAAP